MEQPTARPDSPPTYHQFMDLRADALIESLVAECRAQIPFYATLPVENVRAGVGGTVTHSLAALAEGDFAIAIDWITDLLTRRAGQGLPFSESVMLPVLFRRGFYETSLPALRQGLAGAEPGLALLMEICDRTVVALTQLYQARFEAAASELSLFKTLAEQAIDSISITDQAGRIAYANPAFRELLGYGEELAGMPSLDVIAPASHDQLREVVLPAVRSGGAWRGQVTHLHRDGTPIPTDLSAVMLTGEGGALQAITSIIRDVREQQASEARLRMFELLVENTTDGVMVVDLGNIVRYVNPALVRMSGLNDPADMVGKPATLFFSRQDNERIANEIQPAVLRDGSHQWLVWSRRVDKSTFLGETTSFRLNDAQGNAIGIGGFVRDITANHQAEQERARLQEQIIQVQQEALRELSTPVIPISAQVLVLPLIGSIDSQRARQILETLLEGIQRHRAHTAIIDITGVPIVDTQVANALIRAAQTARLLGSQVILTGIRPEVAQTLVGLGAQLGEIVTHATLQTAVLAALAGRADGR